MGKGWDSGDMGQVAADVEPWEPALIAAVKSLATLQDLPVLFCHQKEDQDPCRWKAMEERRAGTNANPAQLALLFQRGPAQEVPECQQLLAGRGLSCVRTRNRAREEGWKRQGWR